MASTSLSSQVIVWYPCLDDQQMTGLYSQAGSLGLDLLVAEFGVETGQTLILEKSGAPGWRLTTAGGMCRL